MTDLYQYVTVKTVSCHKIIFSVVIKIMVDYLLHYYIIIDYLLDRRLYLSKAIYNFYFLSPFCQKRFLKELSNYLERINKQY